MNRVAIRSTRSLGPVPTTRGHDWVIAGQDGGQSIDLGDRTLFLFSDTLVGTAATTRRNTEFPSALADFADGHSAFLPNCAAIAPHRPLADALTQLDYYLDDDGFPRAILDGDASERARAIRFWPLHGVVHDGLVYLYYLGIRTVDPSSVWGFETLGTGLATFEPKTGRTERLRFADDWRLITNPADDVHFGVQVLQRDAWCYVYASVRHGLSSTARLARVRPDRIRDPLAYELLASAAPTWTDRFDEACSLGPCASDYSVAYNPYLGAYTMWYVDPYKKVLALRTADEPWGPFSDPLEITRVPHEESSEMIYLGFEHPTYQRDRGQTVCVSYCQPRFSRNTVVVVRFR